MRAEIGRHAATTATALAVKQYQLTYTTLSKQTVHEFKEVYLKEKEATNKEVTTLKSRKHRRPILLPEDIITKQNYPNSKGFTFDRCSCKQCCH